MTGNLLAQFTDVQLLQELTRRAIERQTEVYPDQWCDECAHYNRPNASDIEAYDAKPKCKKGHAMKFKCPATPNDEYGYYVLTCVDRRHPY